MKKSFVAALLLILSAFQVYGQYYEVPKRKLAPATMNILCYGKFSLGKDGLYHFEAYNPPKTLTGRSFYDTSLGNERYFGYSKENKMYFFFTDNLICSYQHTTNNNYFWEDRLPKEIKANKVRKMSMQEFPNVLNDIFTQRIIYFNSKNDSINEVMRIQKEAFLKDSIANAEKKQAEMAEYRNNHDWHDLTVTKSYDLKCQCCNKSHYNEKFTVISISADTLYYLLDKTDLSLLDINFTKVHYSKLTREFKNDFYFRDYVTIWRDSIANHNDFSNYAADILNGYRFEKFKEKVYTKAPNGFILKWGWKLNSADGIEPSFSFFNSSKKTIKYVDLYFSIYNAVGDRCYLKYDNSYVGKIRGVGPVESFDSGYWSWDRATHYTSGAASTMKIIKIVLTYMDGSIKTIPQNLILYD